MIRLRSRWIELISLLLFATPALFPPCPAGVSVPSSPRSRSTARRVLPRLQEELRAAKLETGRPVFLRIFKHTSELELWMAARPAYLLFRTYRICAISGFLGPKQQQGDRQAPEGFYRVLPHYLNPASRFHLSFDLGYPNEYDLAWSRTGGTIFVHGNCVSNGCFAMTDPAIEEIYLLVEAALTGGQPYVPVHIFPFRMDRHHRNLLDGAWCANFWLELKPAYDYFETHRRPPVMEVRNRRYRLVPER